MELSEGALKTIMTGGQVDTPIMQILGSKRISGAGDNERYRLLVSDGVHVNSFAMLATQLNDKIRNGELADFTIVRIKRYITSVVPNSGRGEKRVMIILDVEVVAPGSEIGERIGNPISWSGEGAAPGAAPAPAPAAAPTPAPAPVSAPAPVQASRTENGPFSNSCSSSASVQNSRPPAQQQHPQVSPQKPGGSNQNGFGGGYGNNIRSPSKGMGGMELTPDTHSHPIASLTPYQNKWVIKARCTGKTPVKTWSNSKGEGKLFSFDMVDESGEIRVTAFRDQVDKFFDMIEVGKVFLVTRASLKTANKRFSTLNNDYEISLNNETQIIPLHDEDTHVPQMKYNFVPLSEIETMDAGVFVDIIGVVKSAADLHQFTAKASNKEMKKREVTLVDKSNTAVTVTLWNQMAEDFDGSSNPVMAMKGGRISEFGGAKSVNAPMSGFQLNPDMPESHQLKGWFDAEGSSANFKSISVRSGGSGYDDGSLITLKEARDQGLGGGGKIDFYNCKASITMIKSENAMYRACPNDNCNKKVIDHNNGQFRCEKCNAEFPNYKPRLLLSVNVGDWSDNAWITLFQESAEIVLGQTAATLDEFKQNNMEAYQQVFQQATFKSYNFRMRAQVQTYNDEQRLKTTAQTVKKIDHKTYCAKLLSQLKELSGMGTVSN